MARTCTAAPRNRTSAPVWWWYQAVERGERQQTMDTRKAAADDLRGTLNLDTTALSTANGFDTFQRGWAAAVGGSFPLPAFSRDTTADFRVRVRVSMLQDMAITDAHDESAIRTAEALSGPEEVRMYVVRRGAWNLIPPHDRKEVTVSAGQFFLWHATRPSHFAVPPHAQARALVLPSALLGPLIGRRQIAGPADSAEMRVLTAHADMVHETLNDLTPFGVRAVGNA